MNCLLYTSTWETQTSRSSSYQPSKKTSVAQQIPLTSFEALINYHWIYIFFTSALPRKVLVLMLLFLYIYMHRIDLKSSKTAKFQGIFIQIMHLIQLEAWEYVTKSMRKRDRATLHCMQYNIWVSCREKTLLSMIFTLFDLVAFYSYPWKFVGRDKL